MNPTATRCRSRRRRRSASCGSTRAAIGRGSSSPRSSRCSTRSSTSRRSCSSARPSTWWWATASRSSARVFGVEDPYDQLLHPRHHHGGHLGARVDHRLHRRGALAEPGPGHRARDAHGRLPARPGARARLLRGPLVGRADGRAQRRRQPARAVPRRRRQPDDPHHLQRGVRRARLLPHLPRARLPRLPADPGDRGRVAALPEQLEPRYDAVRAAAGRIADTLTNNLGGIATIKAFTAEEREVERVAVDSRAYGEANGEAIRSRAPSSRSSAWRSSPASPSRCVVGGRAVLNGDLEVGLYATSCT